MAQYDSGPITGHSIVSHEDWLGARVAFLNKEKELSRLRDDLNRLRRELPWEAVTKPYAFDGPNGRETLADLFEGRRQLIVYHFMFAPDWKEGCKHCSFWADSFDCLGEHLHARDTTFVAISRAPLEKLEAFRHRMGWSFKWLSSAPSTFNFDYYASFTPDEMRDSSGFYNYRHEESGPEREGASVFYRDELGNVYHTYSTYARGIDLLNTTYNFLDLTPKGRDEEHLGAPQAWLRHHDRYDEALVAGPKR
jgi:predicted dithiol-disulfide oxidoreductase (DUF899 family)